MGMSPHRRIFEQLKNRPAVTREDILAEFEHVPADGGGVADDVTGKQNLSPVFASVCQDGYGRHRNRFVSHGEYDNWRAECEAAATAHWDGRSAKSLERGYLYIAFQRRFLEEAVVSARSLRRHDPHAHITVITDQPHVEPDVFDQFVRRPRQGWGYNKVVYLPESPYRRTIFVDTDTWFCGSIRELFDCLAHYHVAIPQAIGLFHPHSHPVLAETGFPHVPIPGNAERTTGLVVFRDDQTVRNLMSLWKHLYDSLDHDRFEATGPRRPDGRLHSRNDQRYFTAALSASPAKVLPLEANWHFVFRRMAAIAGFVRLLHGRLKGIDRNDHDASLPTGYADALDNLARLVNQSVDWRLWRGDRAVHDF